MGAGVETHIFIAPSQPCHVPGCVQGLAYQLGRSVDPAILVFGPSCAAAEIEIVVCCSSPGTPVKSLAEPFWLRLRMRCSSNSTAAFRSPRPGKRLDGSDGKRIGSPKRTVTLPGRGTDLPFARIRRAPSM